MKNDFESGNCCSSLLRHPGKIDTKKRCLFKLILVPLCLGGENILFNKSFANMT